MDDPDRPATPRTGSSFVASSLQGGDCNEFNMFQMIKRLQQELQEKEKALQEKESVIEILQSQNQGLARTSAESIRAASLQSDTLEKSQNISERRRLQIRAQAVKLRRLHASKQREIPSRFTRVRPDQMAGSALELVAGASQVMSTATLAAGPRPKPDKGQPRKWHFKKIASNGVMTIMPGAFMKRGEHKPGFVSNPGRLAAKVVIWSKFGHISIAAVANAMADELEAVADQMWVAASRSNGSAVRTLPGDGDKPLDVAGRFSEKTVTAAIHAFQMACDGAMAAKLLEADVMHVSVDISTFGTFHMQVVVMYASWVVQKGLDAAGHLLLAVDSLLNVLPSIPVGDKIVREMVDDEGRVMATSTARAAATSLIYSGLVGFAGHPCRSWGVDGGGEGLGAQEEKDRLPVAGRRTTHTSNKNGIGSYRQMCDVTREAYAQAMEKNGPVLESVMDLHGVSDLDRTLLSSRPAPKTLMPVQKYVTCERVLVIRERDTAYVKGRPKWTDKRSNEALPSRPSMRSDPLACMAMVKGGAALVFDCTKHLAHTAAQNSFKLMMPFIRDLASVILALSNVWIHSRVVTCLGKVFALKEGGPVSKLQQEVSDGLRGVDLPLYLAVQALFVSVHAITKLVEACATRWGAVNKGALGLSRRLMAVAAVVPLALSEGTDEGRSAAAVSMWHKDGFRHGGKIRLSPKNGRLCWRLSDPGFIFGNHMTAFFEQCCNGLILDATSHNKEMCAQSIGGVGSVIRRALYFLSRLMWVVLPVPESLFNVTWEDAIKALKKARQTGLSNDKKHFRSLIAFLLAPAALLKRKKGLNYNGGGAWSIMYPLQYKGIVTASPNSGLVTLNPTVNVSPDKRAKSEWPESPIQHCYGPFYRDSMANMIPEMIQVINKLSVMQFDDEVRNFLPKGRIRDVCTGPQKYPWERRRVMLKALFIMTRQTIESTFEKFKGVLSDPHLFLACAAKTETISVVHEGGNKAEYHVATPDAHADAALFQVQMEELHQAYRPQLAEDERLGQFWHGPLAQYISDEKYQTQLKHFRRGNNTSLTRGWTEKGFTNPARAAFQPEKGLAYESLRNNSRPKPLIAFPELAELAYKAMAQPRTQNRAEGVFSVASGAFRAGKRNTGALMWSAIIRKINVKNMKLEAIAQKQWFHRKLSLYIAFGRARGQAIKEIFRPNLGESEQKMEARMLKDMPQFAKAGGAFDNTYICDAVESNKVLKAPNRNGGSAQNKRHRGVDDYQCKDNLEGGTVGRVKASCALRMAARKERRAESDAQPSRPVLQPETQSISRDGRVIADNEGAAQGEGMDLDLQPCLDMDPAFDVDDSAPADTASVTRDVSGLSAAPGTESAATEAAKDLEPVADGMGSGQASGSRPSTNTVLGGSESESEISRDKGKVRAVDDGDDDSDWIQRCIANGGIGIFEDIEVETVDEKVLEQLEASVLQLRKPLSEDGGHGAGSDSDDEAAAQPLSVDRFPDVQARNIGKLKREYAEALATSPSWKRCEIEAIKTKGARQPAGSLQTGTPIKSVTLKRSDEVKFTATAISGTLFYMLRTPSGSELIRIERIFHPPNSSDVMLKYSRVLCSSEAVSASDRPDDLSELHVTSCGKEIVTRRYGSASIQMELDRRKRHRKSELYHWGDITYESSAVDLLGAVYWIPLVEEQEFIRSRQGRIHTRIRTGIQTDFSPGKSLNEMDYVVVGEPFSESRH